MTVTLTLIGESGESCPVLPTDLWPDPNSKPEPKVSPQAETGPDLSESRRCPEASGDGDGAVIIDVCSGKGIGALMLGFALPRAQVVALDANTEMDLAHFRACQNISFRLVDVFSSVFPALVVQTLAGADWAALVGTHLCGALSPRLVSVFRRCLLSVHCMVLSPCCFKGWGGKDAQKRAKVRGVDAYLQLCEDLCGLALSSDIMAAPALDGEELVAQVVKDVGIASVRNRLIIAERAKASAVA